MLATVVIVSVLLALAAAVDGVAGLGQWPSVLVAGVRAAVQLVVVGLVVAAVFRTVVLAPLYLLVMLGVAVRTSARRIGGVRVVVAVAAAISLGTLVPAAVVLAGGGLPVTARAAVPFVAQLTGGAMTAATLAGQRLRDDVRAHWDVVEAWLALGATPAQAVLPMAATAAARALIPAIDQTRNVGLVVLPGAYVGLLLGGASPFEAGRVQLLVLVALLAVETIAAVVVTRALAATLGAVRPVQG